MSLRIGITCYPTYGGSGIVATELGKELAERGHRIHFISYALPQRLIHFHPRLFFHEVEVVSYPLFVHPPYILALASKMAEVAQYEKLDLLHVHYAIPHAAAAYIAKKIHGNKIKIVTTLHGTDITLVGSDRTFLPVTRFSIEGSDGVTAVSRYLKRITLKEINVKKDIRVIPNFINTTVYRRFEGTDCRPKLARRGDKVLIHVSNFRPVKRIDDVVMIFKQVAQKVPSQLLLVGDGPERSRIESLVRAERLQEKVHFLGKQESVVELLSCADLMLLPSETESFGLAALEAMSCGVPTVASRVGGLPEVVTHGETGYLHPMGKVQEMAEAAITVLKNDRLWHKMSVACRKRAESLFATERILPKYEKFYEEILNG
ncbi:MAG: N-acetyl-alpha-D-glucosaminyl L-malate synthase BshA [Acidobacteriota bacterium]